MVHFSLGNRGPKLTGEKISSPKNHLRKINFHGIQESDPPENQNQKIANYWWYQETLLAATNRQKKQGVDLNSEVAVRVRWDKAEDLSLEEYQGMHNAETHAADSRWNTPSKN